MTEQTPTPGAAVKKGDVFSRIHIRNDGWHAPTAHQFMVVTSVRKGVVRYRRCEHKRDAQHWLNHCDQLSAKADGFREWMASWGWQPDTLDDAPR